MATDTPAKLTAKQEKYAQLRAIHGLNETEAYLLSYEGDKTVRPALYVRACEVEKNRKVAVRIQALEAEIRKATIEADIADLVERKVHATTVLRHDGASRRDQLAANRLLGEYEKELGAGAQPVTNVYGDVYVTQVTQQLSLLMAEADARWPGLLDWYRERVKALGEG